MKKFLGEISQQLRACERRISKQAQARLTDAWEHAEELYGENKAANPRGIPEFVPAGQGIMKVTHFPGLRGVRFPSPIWQDRIGVVCNGSLPATDEELPDYLADLKTEVARRFARGNIESICVTSNGAQIDVREGWADYVHIEVYRALAECALKADPRLDAIRLLVDERAPESRYSGWIIQRSMPERLQGPVAAS